MPSVWGGTESVQYASKILITKLLALLLSLLGALTPSPLSPFDPLPLSFPSPSLPPSLHTSHTPPPAPSPNVHTYASLQGHPELRVERIREWLPNLYYHRDTWHPHLPHSAFKGSYRRTLPGSQCTDSRPEPDVIETPPMEVRFDHSLAVVPTILRRNLRGTMTA